MIVALAAALLTSEPPPPGLLFGYYRMLAFEKRSQASRCGTGDLDRELDGLRDRLAARYGKTPFSPPAQPVMPGECSTIVTVYRVNLADFRKEAEAALASPTNAAPPQE